MRKTKSDKGIPAPLKAAAASAGGLTAAAILNRWLAVRAQQACPPIGSVITVNRVPVHYIARGDGPAVVLIHGSGSLVQDFTTSGLVDRLARSHRVLAFDRPGYGYTERPRGIDWTPEEQARLLVAACAQLGVERPLVVGHSWGTLVALAWALDHPDRIGKLALLSGYYYKTPRPDAALMALMGSPALGDAIVHTVAPLQARLTGPLGVKHIFSPNSPTDTFVDEMSFGLMLRPKQLLATARDSGQMPVAAGRLSRRYGELRLPMTIVWGDGDKLVKQGDHSAKLAVHLPHASAIELEGVGHMVHHVAPAKVASVIETLDASSN